MTFQIQALVFTCGEKSFCINIHTVKWRQRCTPSLTVYTLWKWNGLASITWDRMKYCGNGQIFNMKSNLRRGAAERGRMNVKLKRINKLTAFKGVLSISFWTWFKKPITKAISKWLACKGAYEKKTKSFVEKTTSGECPPASSKSVLYN